MAERVTPPPRRQILARDAVAAPCPYCGSDNTERNAIFGPFHMSEAYTCRVCFSPFSRIKWGDDDEPSPPPQGSQ